MLAVVFKVAPEAEKTRRGKFIRTVPRPHQNTILTFFGINFGYSKIILQIERFFRMYLPAARPQAMARRMYFVNIVAAFYCQN